MEKREVKKVGKITFAASTLPNAARIPTTEVGIICKEVALSTKNIHEAYSALGDLSSSLAAVTP